MGANDQVCTNKQEAQLEKIFLQQNPLLQYTPLPTAAACG